MLACPACGAHYGPDNLDLELSVAHCPSCGKVGELRVAGTLKEATELTAAPPLVPARPGAWKEEQAGGELVLSSKWFGFESVFLLFFTAVWDGIMVVAFVSMLAQEGLAAFGLLAVPHTWVGVGLAYYSVAQLLNTTTVRVSRERVEVGYGPVPWWGGRRFERGQIHQLYVEESGVRVNKQPRWNLSLMDKDTTGHVLLRLLRTPGEARWLEHRIEGEMGIADVAVVGEVAK